MTDKELLNKIATFAEEAEGCLHQYWSAKSDYPIGHADYEQFGNTEENIDQTIRNLSDLIDVFKYLSGGDLYGRCEGLTERIRKGELPILDDE